jgi:hypothetical protein
MAEDAANLAHDLGSGVAPRIEPTMVEGVATYYVDMVSVTKDNMCEFLNTISPPGWINTDEVFGAGVNPCK